MDAATISTITAISSVAIALAAFFVAWWTGHVQREHAKLSVLPHLDFIYGNTSTGSLALLLINNGVGPAVITGFDIFVAGALIKPAALLGTWYSAFAAADDSAPSKENVPSVGQYIRAREKFLLLDAGSELSLAPNTDEAVNVARRYEASLAKFTVCVNYRSLYGQQFQTSWCLSAHAKA